MISPKGIFEILLEITTICLSEADELINYPQIKREMVEKKLQTLEAEIYGAEENRGHYETYQNGLFAGLGRTMKSTIWLFVQVAPKEIPCLLPSLVVICCPRQDGLVVCINPHIMEEAVRLVSSYREAIDKNPELLAYPAKYEVPKKGVTYKARLEDLESLWTPYPESLMASGGELDSMTRRALRTSESLARSIRKIQKKENVDGSIE